MTTSLKLGEDWLWRCHIADSNGDVVFTSRPFFFLADARKFLGKL